MGTDGRVDQLTPPDPDPRSAVKTSKKVLLGTALGAAALVAAAAIWGPGIYRDYIAPPAADTPGLAEIEPGSTLGSSSGSAGSSSGSDTPSSSADYTGTWNVTTGSEAGYRVNEVLNGTNVTVTGRTEKVTGSFTIGDGGRTLEAAELTVDVASISTGTSQRDNYFRTQALRAQAYPTASFVLSEPVSLDASPAAGEIVRATAVGELTIAGVTRTVTATVEVRSDGTTAEIAGSIPITFSDFGVTAPNLGFVSVEKNGFVEFQLVAAKG